MAMLLALVWSIQLVKVKRYMKRTFQFQIEGFKVRTVHAEAESETVTITKGGVLRSFGLVNPLEYEEV